jgi:60S ribosome subunit biogenesis protein NIP7
MRPLTEPETQTLFRKLANYTGGSLTNLIAPLDNSPNADRYVFRLHRDRVYYVLLSIANLATSIARDKLLSIGVCLGECKSLIRPSRDRVADFLQANSQKLGNSGCT